MATSNFLIYSELEEFMHQALMKVPIAGGGDAGSTSGRLAIGTRLLPTQENRQVSYLPISINPCYPAFQLRPICGDAVTQIRRGTAELL